MLRPDSASNITRTWSYSNHAHDANDRGETKGPDNNSELGLQTSPNHDTWAFSYFTGIKRRKPRHETILLTSGQNKIRHSPFLVFGGSWSQIVERSTFELCQGPQSHGEVLQNGGKFSTNARKDSIKYFNYCRDHRVHPKVANFTGYMPISWARNCPHCNCKKSDTETYL